MKRKTILITGVIILLFVVGTFLTIHYYPKHDSFSRISFLKLNIPLGGEAISKVKITNYKETEQVFALSFSNLEGIASLSETGFTLGVGEKKEVEIYFKDTKNEAGIYLGQLVIEAGSVIEKIPVVLEMYDPNYAFAIIHSEILKYDSVYPGSKWGTEIEVYDMGNIASPTVTGTYYIKNFDNEILFSDQEDFTLEGSKSILVDIPKTWDKGYYVFVTEIDYRGTKSIASSLFNVGKKTENGFLSGDVKFLAVILLVFVMGILALFIYFIKTRDDLLLQLRKQQGQELRRNVQYIKVSRREVERSEEHPEKKRRKLIELDKIKERVIRKVKKRQKEQRVELKELKKKKKKPQAKSQLEKWKTQGYKMFDTESEVRKVTKKSMGKQMKGFKEGGYATGFLKK